MPRARCHDPCAVLPDLALELITARLTVADLARASCVSKAFRQTFVPPCRAKMNALFQELKRALTRAIFQDWFIMPSACIAGVAWTNQRACDGAIPGRHHKMYDGPKLLLVPITAEARASPYMSSYMHGLITVGPVRIMQWDVETAAVPDLVPGIFRTTVPAPNDDAAAAFSFLVHIARLTPWKANFNFWKANFNFR